MPRPKEQVGPFISQEIVRDVKNHPRYSDYQNGEDAMTAQKQIIEDTGCDETQLLAISNGRYQS